MSEHVKLVEIGKITVAENRFRQEFAADAMAELQESLQRDMGLMHPLIVDSKFQLIAGERRYKAISTLYDLETSIKFNGSEVSLGFVPVIVASDSLTEVDLLRAELEENAARSDFTYLEKAAAIAKIAVLEQKILNAKKASQRKDSPEGENVPEPEEVKEAINLLAISPEAIKATAEKVYDNSSGGFSHNVRKAIEITAAVQNGGELGKKLESAKSLNDATKLMNKHAEETRRATLAQSVGKNFTSSMHTIIHGDCLAELVKLEAGSYDVCITDPIYGINSHLFGDSAGRYQNISHEYDDSPETFERVMPLAIKLMTRLMKQDAHIYLACDIRNYFKLKEWIEQTGPKDNPWKVPNAPLIQYKIAGGKVPHPGFTYRNSYELWIYAHRGKKQLNNTINNVIECESDRTETHGASKPVDLLKTFLRNSTQAGDRCLDFMAGSGGIVTACHDLKVRCTAIEVSKSYYGRIIQRVKDLK